MTAPVLKVHPVVNGTMKEAIEMMFYLNGSRPESTNNEVAVITKPPFRAYVR